MEVPWYQLAVHLGAAALLLFAAIYTPLLFDRRLPRWLELTLVVVAVVLAGSAALALVTGHWPLRG